MRHTKNRKKMKSKAKIRYHSALPVLEPDVAGIDIGSREHWVCGPQRKDGKPNVKSFGTITSELERLVAWLADQGVVSVAMESTHVYWIPVYELLESNGIQVLLVNARMIHKVPGRKTDVADCQWLQMLHSCGLLKGSFRPSESVCQLRALQRQVGNLMEERTKTIMWMQKALDQMNVQVHRAVSDLTGKTGMSILREIAAGERDPRALAEFRDKRCKHSKEEIAEYLKGTWREEHLFNLTSAIRFFDVIEAEIELYNNKLQEIMRDLQPPERKDKPVPAHPKSAKEALIKRQGDHQKRTDLWRLCGFDLTTIDGISPTTAMAIVTEIGTDVSAFPSEKDFVSWLRLSPCRPISGGKQLRKRPNGTGANRMSGVLRLSAVSVGRSKTALGAYFRRLSRRKDGKIAVFATARKIAQLVYRVMRWGQAYVDEGQEAYEARHKRKRLAGLISTAKEMGFELTPVKHST